MTILQQPDNISFCGNLKKIIVALSAETELQFRLLQGGSVLIDEIYTSNGTDNIEIVIDDIIDGELSLAVPDTSELFIQPDLAKEFTAEIGGQSISFKVIKGGVANLSESATDFLKGNFLTWQEQSKYIISRQPEWLSYFAQVNGKLKLKAYLGNDTTAEKEWTLTAGNVYSANMNYGQVNSYFAEQVGYYDVWVEDLAGTRLTYVQRYILTPEQDDSEIYPFNNSLGGLDSVVFTGEKKINKKTKHSSASVAGEDNEYDIDFSVVFTQYTGVIKNEDQANWLQDFITSKKRYHIKDGAIVSIVFEKQSQNISNVSPLSIFSFDYRYSQQTVYQNVVRNRESLPEVLEFPEVEDLFFLAPRLSQYPAFNIDQSLLIPCQLPFGNEWGRISLYSILNEMDLTAFAEKSWVNAQGFLKAEALSSYAEKVWVINQGFLVQDDLIQYATKEDIAGITGGNAEIIGYAKEAWVNDNFYNKTVADQQFSKLVGGNDFQGNQRILGDLSVNGNIIQYGELKKIIAEHVYVKDEFVNLRDGATVAIGPGMLSGFTLGNFNGFGGKLLLGGGSDGVARVGHQGGELQALLTREDSPSKGLLWYDETTKKAMGCGILTSDLHLANWDLAFANMGKLYRNDGIWLQSFISHGETATLGDSYIMYKAGADYFKFRSGYADDAAKLGGRAAADYWHKDNLNRSDVDFVARNLTLYGNFSSESYVSGFGGHGYLLDHNTASLTLDNLTVRQTMNIYELIINKIRSGNGSYWFSDGMKYTVDYGSNTSYYRIGQDADGGNMPEPFVQGDIVRCQQWTGKGIKYYTLIVEDILNDATRSYFKAATGSKAGTGVPELGDELVRIGNVLDANRQGAVYITSNDDDSPYIDIIDGIGGDYAYNNSFTLNGGSDAKYYTFPITGEIPETVHLSGSYLLYLDDGTVSPRTTVVFKYSDGSAETAIFISHIKDGNYHSLWRSAHPNPDKTLVEIKGWIADHSSGSENKHSVFDNIKISLIYNSMNSKSVARLGKLDGILSPTFGQLNGYGIHTNGGYFENVKVSGEINVTGGNAATKEYTDSSATSTKDLLASKLGYANYNALMNEAINGNTLIKGGVINTDLVAAKAITANMIDVSGLFVGTGGIRMDASATIDWNQVIGGQDAINNIQIGGRNLIRGSKLINVNSYINMPLAETIIQGEQFTLSFSEINNNKTDNRLLVYALDASENSYSVCYFDKTKPHTPISFTAALNINSIRIYATKEWTSDGVATIKELQLEKGNKATDWTPAPEDVQGQIDSKSDTWVTTITNNTIQTTNVIAQNLQVNMANILGELNASKIVAGSITTSKLAATCITADKIAAGAITADKLHANAITADRINALHITALGAVTAATFQLGDGNFNVDAAGNLAAKNAVIEGVINATTGKMGGWDIFSNLMQSVSGNFKIDANEERIEISNVDRTMLINAGTLSDVMSVAQQLTAPSKIYNLDGNYDYTGATFRTSLANLTLYSGKKYELDVSSIAVSLSLTLPAMSLSWGKFVAKVQIVNATTSAVIAEVITSNTADVSGSQALVNLDKTATHLKKLFTVSSTTSVKLYVEIVLSSGAESFTSVGSVNFNTCTLREVTCFSEITPEGMQFIRDANNYVRIDTRSTATHFITVRKNGVNSYLG